MLPTLDVYSVGRWLHSLAGIVALVAFWRAANASKGSDAHMRHGRTYLFALLLVMLLSMLMVGAKVMDGDIGSAIFFVFLISMVGTASFLTLAPIRWRKQPERITGLVYRCLASWLILAGSGLFVIGVARRVGLIMFLSLLGVAFGSNMWRLARRPRVAENDFAWLEHHLNGVMLNFIATHDSFLAIGLGSYVPNLRESVQRMIVAVIVTAMGLFLRYKAGKMYLAPRVAQEQSAADARLPRAKGEHRD